MNDDPNRPSRRWLIAVIGVWLAALLILPPPFNGWLLWATIPAGIALYLWQIPRERKQRFFARFEPITRPFFRLLRAISGWVQPPSSEQPIVKVIPARIRYPALILGLVMLIVLAEIDGNMLHLPFLQYVSSHVQFVILCVGIGLVAWGFAGNTGPPPYTTNTRWETPPARSPVATSSGSPLKQADSSNAPLAPAIFRWLTRKSSRMSSSVRRRKPKDIYLIVFITLLAFALRLLQLEDSLRTWVDEVNFGDQVVQFIDHPYNPILSRSDPTMAFPRLYVYGQYLSVSLLGRTLEGLRLFSVFIGTLTIPAVYVLGRCWFDRRMALVATLLLATFPPHLQFSRIGLNNVADPLVGTLLLAMLARLNPRVRRQWLKPTGYQRTKPTEGADWSRINDVPLQSAVLTPLVRLVLSSGMVLTCRASVQEIGVEGARFEKYITRADLVLAGVLLGLTQYFYEAGRYVFPALALICLGTLWLRGRMRWRDLRLLLLVAVIVAAPVYYCIFAARLPLTPRLNETSSVVLPYMPRLLTTFLVYVSQPDMRLFIYYYGGQTALILPAFVPLFLGGVAYALRWMWRWPGMMLLLLWLAFTSLGNSFLIVPGVYARYVVAFPALALLLAVGMCYALPGVVGWFGNIVGRGDLVGRPYNDVKGVHLDAPTTLIISLTLIIAAAQTIYYFGVHLPGYREQIRREYGGYDTDDAILRAAELPNGTQVFFINKAPPDEGTLALRLKFLNDRLKVYSFSLDTAKDYLATLETDSLAFFVAPYDVDTLRLLQQYYRLDGPYYSYHIPLDDQFLLFFPQP